MTYNFIPAFANCIKIMETVATWGKKFGRINVTMNEANAFRLNKIEPLILLRSANSLLTTRNSISLNQNAFDSLIAALVRPNFPLRVLLTDLLSEI